MATALSELTTLRLGGPARRFAEARDEAAIVAAVQAADDAGEPLLIVAGGSNLVVADAGFPGTVLRIASRGIAGGTVAAGEDWDAVRRPLRRRRPRGRRVPLRHPRLRRRDADPERRRLRAGGRGRDRLGPRLRPPRARGRRDPGRGLRLLLPLERVQARPRPLGRALRDVRPAAAGPLDADPLRRARPRARRRAGRDGAARRRPRRRARGCAGARAWSSTRPTPTPCPPARSSRTPC